MLKNKKKLTRLKVFFVAFVLGFMALPNSIVALEESDTEFSFSVVEGQGVGDGSIRILEAGTTEQAMFFMPQQEYDLEISLFDLAEDGLDNLELKMWFDETGEGVMESRFNDIDEYDGQKSIAIRWNKEDGAVLDSADDTWELLLEDGAVLDSADDTWELLLEDSVISDVEEMEESDILEYEFVFRVKIGKVARMTTDSSKWQTAFVVNDGEVYDYHKHGNGVGLDMEWYGEVESPDQVQWGNIRAGIDYDDFGAKQRIGEIKYISNGDYLEQVRFGSNWSSSEGESEAVLVQEPVNDNEFSLKINSIDALDTAKQIPSDGSFLAIDGVNEPTDHNGAIKDEYHVYINLSDVFDAGYYTGNITFGIANGL